MNGVCGAAYLWQDLVAGQIRPSGWLLRIVQFWMCISRNPALNATGQWVRSHSIFRSKDNPDRRSACCTILVRSPSEITSVAIPEYLPLR